MRITKLNELIEGDKIVKGKWTINKRHEIQYRRDKKREQVRLKASILGVEPSSLVLSLTERQADQKTITRIHKLTGKWLLDGENRILFEVRRERGKSDVLTFRGGWRVGRNHDLIYTYRGTQLKTKKKIERVLVFKGYWDITERNRLTYFLRRESNSAFRFRGAFQTRSILAKRRQIRYQVGTELKGRRVVRIITLFGKWKVSRDLSLSFEMEYGRDHRRAIHFGGQYAFSKEQEVRVRLTSRHGTPLGVEVIFTRDIFDDRGQAFARLVRSSKESRLEGGVKVGW